MSQFRLYDLNPEQYRAATHGGGPMLILAGAGTGKTRVITARISWLIISQGVAPDSILAVTFTNKAAREMKERISGMVTGTAAGSVTVCTFHALCVRILRRYIDRLGYKLNFTIYDDGDQLGLIKKIINRTAASDEKLEPNVARALISKAKNQGLGPPQDDETLVGAVYARYQQELKNLNAVDFDDLLILAVQLLNEFPDIQKTLQEQYRHLLVDEFQDTNNLQMQLVALLASGKRPNVCVVGDDDQSIYGWRGADISNILEFESHFPDPEVFKLEQNYRSTNQILGAANRLIENNQKRRSKKLWSEHKSTENIRVVAVVDDRSEAEFVIDELIARRERERLPWEHFAIIYRMNAQARLFEENLRRMRIPYRLIGGRSFFDRREVKDILAYLATIFNPQDDQSLLRIIQTPPRGIGAVTVENALEQSRKDHKSLFESLTDPDWTAGLATRARESIQKFAEDLQVLKIKLATPGIRVAAEIKSYLTDCGYFDYLRRNCKTPEETKNRENAVYDILNDLDEFQTKNKKEIHEFLDEMALHREREEDKEDKGRGVTLITMHASKGLEFPYVSLVGVEEGILPHDRSKVEGSVDEERRLFYVGITRAMKSLTITHCQSRMRFGTKTFCLQSSFLKEILGEGIEQTSQTEINNTPVNDDDADDFFAQLRASISED
ncbi:MAG: ATP-dependent helicase [Chthoniobacterales bacterium]